MTATIRLLLLVAVLAYSTAFSSTEAPAAHAHARRPHPSERHDHVRMPRHRTRARARAAHTETLGDRAVRFARGLLGIPYRWGGDSPSTGFDCSGFVRFVYAHFGVALPHSSYEDYRLGMGVPRRSLRPGDLVFFNGEGHVGMYVGAGRFIQAPHTGTSVQVTSLDEPWYASAYDGARRLLPTRQATSSAALRRRNARRLAPLWQWLAPRVLHERSQSSNQNDVWSIARGRRVRG
jgi:cell wall-associated NlpC family hydrolase